MSDDFFDRRHDAAIATYSIHASFVDKSRQIGAHHTTIAFDDAYFASAFDIGARLVAIDGPKRLWAQDGKSFLGGVCRLLCCFARNSRTYSKGDDERVDVGMARVWCLVAGSIGAKFGVFKASDRFHRVVMGEASVVFLGE